MSYTQTSRPADADKSCKFTGRNTLDNLVEVEVFWSFKGGWQFREEYSSEQLNATSFADAVRQAKKMWRAV